MAANDLDGRFYWCGLSRVTVDHPLSILFSDLDYKGYVLHEVIVGSIVMTIHNNPPKRKFFYRLSIMFNLF